MDNEKLRRGSTGDVVRRLQSALNQNGYGLKVDGVYGDKTQSAVKDYQRSRNLPESGEVGEAT